MTIDMNVEDTSAFMGLENLLSREIYEEVLDNRRIVKIAVCHEQKRQMEAKTYDPNVLSLVSQSFSEWSRKRARIIGLIHAD
eukprot:CAMPEP_0183736506 /NCGR_PEP_ID=MMETSP0737-20130205/49455_1 /TAXON_ID=385413 /ORGANISM="Thalassiosira miniscula, Strain CCMP1093" /LENGTH=81 /DNA_ID=CAMNT_0025970519 /DNA_START=347 /DNA_END=592 /DNA_ORIENTATION=+